MAARSIVNPFLESPVAAPAPARTSGARAWALAGTALIAGGVVAVLALHVITLEEINPLRRTLSLVRAGLVPLRGAAVSLLAAWSACLVVVVAFEKIDWSVGPTPTGYAHRYASLLAFFCLPAAALALGRAWRGDERWGALARATWWLGVASLGWLVPILLGFVLRPLTGVPWWQFVPLGLFERGLALTEVAALVVMGIWVARAARPS